MCGGIGVTGGSNQGGPKLPTKLTKLAQIVAHLSRNYELEVLQVTFVVTVKSNNRSTY